MLLGVEQDADFLPGLRLAEDRNFEIFLPIAYDFRLCK